MSGPRHSKRFKPSIWTEWVVPAILIILVLVLLLILVLIGLAVIGLTPGS